MNRRELLRQTGLAGLGVGLLGARVEVARGRDSAVEASRQAPAVFAPRPDGVTVVWPVAGPSLGWLEYGEAGDTSNPRLQRGDGFGTIPHGERVLRVRLNGLKPGGRYWFRTQTQPLEKPEGSAIGREVIAGEAYEFRLPNPTASVTRFDVWNDTHDHPETLAKLAGMTQPEGVDFLLWNGDISNNIHTESMIPGLYLNPRGGVDLAKGPAIYFNRGNHDVRGAAANRLPGYVDYPDGRPYYSFRSGPLGAVVLDTGEDKPDDHPSFLGLVDFAALIQEQAEWLAEEIEKPHLKDAPYKVVFCHIPLRWRDETPPDYARGGFDHVSLRGRAAWHGAIARWGAQIIISGHTHQQFHLPATSEFPYEQITGGGPKLGGNARLIRAQADERGLVIRMLDPQDGRETFSRALRPLV